MTNRRTALICFLLAMLVPAAIRVVADDTASKPKRNAQPVVILTIDYGDGAQKRFPKVPIANKMSVLDSLVWASKHPHGIELKHRGKGTIALVSQIDDLKNGGGNGKNWIFYVNKKLADRSCGAYEVVAGDEILWRFEVYE